MQLIVFLGGYLKGVLKFMSLTKKEKDFCKYFCVCKNHREAAFKAGFAFPEISGMRLLLKSEIKEELQTLSNEVERFADVSDGLRRIAFGSVADAVKLALNADEIGDVENLDLFSVQEIKFAKNGGIEIKFYDRIKALEALASMPDGSGDDTTPFIEAIVKGSEAIAGSIRSEDDEV